MRLTIIDTNIIVGHFIESNTKLNELLTTEEFFYIPIPKVLELMFVLEKKYIVGRKKIKEIVEVLCHHQKIQIEYYLIQQLLKFYLQSPKISIIDCYVLALS